MAYLNSYRERVSVNNDCRCPRTATSIQSRPTIRSERVECGLHNPPIRSRVLAGGPRQSSHGLRMSRPSFSCGLRKRMSRIVQPPRFCRPVVPDDPHPPPPTAVRQVIRREPAWRHGQERKPGNRHPRVQLSSGYVTTPDTVNAQCVDVTREAVMFATLATARTVEEVGRDGSPCEEFW